MSTVPVIDIAPLRSGGRGAEVVATAIDRACREVGFFCIAGHGASLDVLASLDEEARRFFASLDESEKAAIAIGEGLCRLAGLVPPRWRADPGRARRQGGPVLRRRAGGPGHPRGVRAGRPLHGANLFPLRPAGPAGGVVLGLD